MWVYFPEWSGGGVEPGLKRLLESQGIHTCTNVSILLNIKDAEELNQVCTMGCYIKGESHVAKCVATSENVSCRAFDTQHTEIDELKLREAAWQKKMQKMSSLITQLQDEKRVLQANLLRKGRYDEMNADINNIHSIYSTYDIFANFRGHDTNTP